MLGKLFTMVESTLKDPFYFEVNATLWPETDEDYWTAELSPPTVMESGEGAGPQSFLGLKPWERIDFYNEGKDDISSLFEEIRNKLEELLGGDVPVPREVAPRYAVMDAFWSWARERCVAFWKRLREDGRTGDDKEFFLFTFTLSRGEGSDYFSFWVSFVGEQDFELASKDGLGMKEALAALLDAIETQAKG